MIARLLISSSIDARIEEIDKALNQAGLTRNRPDLMYFTADSKLGIEQARKIKEHFSLKPYSAKGRAVILEDASNLTHEAQNALLKILEEPPTEALLILGAPSDAKFLPTVLSRCQIVRIQPPASSTQPEDYTEDIRKLLRADTQERFEYIEKLKDKEDFLRALVQYFHQNLPKDADFVKKLLSAEEWANQNVNIRAILEYLMLVMPKKI